MTARSGGGRRLSTKLFRHLNFVTTCKSMAVRQTWYLLIFSEISFGLVSHRFYSSNSIMFSTRACSRQLLWLCKNVTLTDLESPRRWASSYVCKDFFFFLSLKLKNVNWGRETWSLELATFPGWNSDPNMDYNWRTCCCQW